MEKLVKLTLTKQSHGNDPRTVLLKKQLVPGSEQCTFKLINENQEANNELLN